VDEHTDKDDEKGEHEEVDVGILVSHLARRDAFFAEVLTEYRPRRSFAGRQTIPLTDTAMDTDSLHEHPYPSLPGDETAGRGWGTHRSPFPSGGDFLGGGSGDAERVGLRLADVAGHGLRQL